ncbi:TPA: PTS lactose/cellobiose transporter subunit IIA [Photobacterium damselae]
MTTFTTTASINESTLEAMIMELLVTSGHARSCALLAIQAAKKNEQEQAQLLLNDAKDAINDAHKIQTELIGVDEGCGKLPVTLITVHAQDHLMNAMVIYDLAQDVIELYRRTAHL